MISLEKYKKILDEGLLLDHYIILCKIKDGSPLPESKRVIGFTNLLAKRGFTHEGNITQKGNDLVGEDLVVENTVPTKVIVVETSQSIQKFDYARWVISLHRKCEAKIVEATGKRQVRDTINGKPYSFLPNSTDLGKAILRVIDSYKIKDYDRIERTILAYIDRCIKSKQWFPILVYYIIKNNMSAMVTDMETIDDNEAKSDDTIVNI